MRHITLVVALAALLLTGQQAHAGLPPLPTETPTATPTATPSVKLNPPTVSYDELANLVTWTDNSIDEEGFRIVVTIGQETRVFEVGSNVEQLQLPGEFRPGCPDRPSIFISVTAFLGALESEPGTAGFFGICTPATITPTPRTLITPTATSLLSLPATGTKHLTDGTSVMPMLLVALALFVGLGMLVGVLYGARRRIARP